MGMTTAELRRHLRELPPKQADEIRRERKRASLRRYRTRYLAKERARQADWYQRRMTRLREDPEQLALVRAKDAERKRQERALQKESGEKQPSVPRTKRI
jgi:hypothetical protein